MEEGRDKANAPQSQITGKIGANVKVANDDIGQYALQHCYSLQKNMYCLLYS